MNPCDGVAFGEEVAQPESRTILSACAHKDTELFFNPNDILQTGSFEGIQVRDNVRKGAYAYGFEAPLPIQESAIFHMCSGLDFISKTRFGAAMSSYIIGILQLLNATLKETQALVLAATQHEVDQIQKAFSAIGQYINFTRYSDMGAPVFIGEHPQITIFTPDRTFQMLNENTVTTTTLRIAVIDGLDRVLSHGVRTKLHRNFRIVPSYTQVSVFSSVIFADMTEIIIKCREGLLPGHNVNVTSGNEASTVSEPFFIGHDMINTYSQETNNTHNDCETASKSSDNDGEKYGEEKYGDENYSMEISCNEEEIVDSFLDMNIRDDVLYGIYRYGVSRPSPIQQRAIIPICLGRNVIIENQMETEMLAFAVGILERIDTSDRRTLQALVVTSSASRAAEYICVLNALGTIGLCCFECTERKPLIHDIHNLRLESAHIIVGTPDRILRLAKQCTISFSSLDTALFDQVDGMVSCGLLKSVNRILEGIPCDCQISLSCKRIQKGLETMIDTFMHNPIHIRVMPKHL